MRLAVLATIFVHADDSSAKIVPEYSAEPSSIGHPSQMNTEQSTLQNQYFVHYK